MVRETSVYGVQRYGWNGGRFVRIRETEEQKEGRWNNREATQLRRTVTMRWNNREATQLRRTVTMRSRRRRVDATRKLMESKAQRMKATKKADPHCGGVVDATKSIMWNLEYALPPVAAFHIMRWVARKLFL